MELISSGHEEITTGCVSHILPDENLKIFGCTFEPLELNASSSQQFDPHNDSHYPCMAGVILLVCNHFKACN